ncbi:RNA polymerase sigma factor [Halalkalibaculum sp. DA384]|uniref:RNA polymerase sigma factor n=1 Tax=Halalkalibaculum sp. DA384 TaxID=3373606 RepID=UPI00375402D3
MGKGKAKSTIWSEFVNGNNQKKSYKDLFDAYYDGLYGYGTKICQRPEVVKDCIQDLFQNVWERRGELDHIDSPNVYLFVSLRRKILKKLKKNKKIGDLSELDPNIFIEFSREDLIITDEIKHKNKDKLQKALNKLPERQKEVILLHFFNGMSYGEIEEILSINRQSVYNHIYRAMETLRSLLDNEIMKLVISMMLSFISYSHFFIG